MNVTWSPLYTAFLGTVRALSGDDATIAIPVHRVLIVLAVALLVLALLRRLLPAPIALLAACWWAVLPIAFDTVVEVHLFAVLPLAGTALLLTDDPGPWRRGWALALIVAGAVLVRNESALIALALLVALAAAELRRRRRGAGTPLRELLVATVVPLAVALAAIGVFHERSILQWGDARAGWQAKQTLNVCQVFGTSYQQRHPEYRGNPFLDCETLMREQFDKPRPTLADAWQANPGEMAAFTAWNLHLLPAGIQLGLFDRVTADDNPDYPSARLESQLATLLTIVLVALLAAGGRALWRERSAWRPTLARQRWAWLALGATAVATLLVVVLDARPRPAYMFGLTIGIVALAGLALAALTRGRAAAERALALVAATLPLVLVLALPSHYRDGPTPLADQYERLRAVVPDGGPATLAVPLHPYDACAYLVPIGQCRGLALRGDLAGRPAPPFESLLAEEGVDAVYVDAEELARPGVAGLVSDPSPAGWRLAAMGGGRDDRWAVLVRRTAPFSRSPR